MLNKDILSYDGYMPLTKRAVAELKRQGLVQSIRPVTDKDLYSGPYYPLNGFYWAGHAITMVLFGFQQRASRLS